MKTPIHSVISLFGTPIHLARLNAKRTMAGPRKSARILSCWKPESLNRAQRCDLVAICDREGRQMHLKPDDHTKLKRLMKREPQFAARVSMIIPKCYTPAA